MVQIISPSQLTIPEVETKFQLQSTENPTFFREWQEKLPELSDEAKKSLDRVKSEFLYLNKYPLFEEAVKMVVLSPLLTQAGFYRPPFRIREEVPVQIVLEREGELVRGRIDVLVVQEQLWVLVIESKQASFSLKEAIPQALSYMVTAPYPEQPVFGFITNGSHFVFLKLQRANGQYALSDEFSLFRRVNELYTVLQVLQSLGQTMSDPSS